MLSDTIRKVNEAEQQAGVLLLDAEKESAAIIEAAKEKAKQLKLDAEANAKQQAKDLLAEAQGKAEQEKEEYAAALQSELQLAKELALSKEEQAVEAILADLV